jgi:RND family efflux transporter MFP subunit
MKPLRFLTFLVVFGALAFGAWRAFQHKEEHEEEEAAPESEVVVQVAKITRTTLHRSVTVRGIVEPEHASADRPAALALLAVPSAGLVQQVLCTEGQAVKKGDVLLKLDSRAAEGKITEAKKALEFAVQQSERQKALLKVDGTSQKAAQEADAAVQKAKLDIDAAEGDLALLHIEAPISGVAIEVEVRAGESAEPGKPVITVLDPTRLTFRGQVPAADLHEIQPGQPVEYVNAGKPLEAQGKVLLVSPRLDEQTGAAEVIASVPPDAGLPSGAWIEARVLTETHKDCLAVPLASVVKGEEGESTISIVEGDTAKQHEVKTGLREGALIEVIGEDIKEGDTVASVGAYGLPKETKVSVPQAGAEAHEP